VHSFPDPFTKGIQVKIFDKSWPCSRFTALIGPVHVIILSQTIIIYKISIFKIHITNYCNCNSLSSTLTFNNVHSHVPILPHSIHVPILPHFIHVPILPHSMLFFTTLCLTAFPLQNKVQMLVIYLLESSGLQFFFNFY